MQGSFTHRLCKAAWWTPEVVIEEVLGRNYISDCGAIMVLVITAVGVVVIVIVVVVTVVVVVVVVCDMKRKVPGS